MVLKIAKQVVKEGKAEDFLKALKPLEEASNKEEGCIEYILYNDRENSNIFTVVEKWKDMAAIEAHNSSEHFTAIVPKLADFVAEKEVTLHNPV